MRTKERKIKRHLDQVLRAYWRAAFVLIFVMGFWLGMASSGHSAGALLFDGNDDFLVTTFDPSQGFDQLTLMLWVKRGISPTDAESSYARAVDQLPPTNGFTKTSYSIFTLQPDKFDPKRFGFKFSNAARDWEIWAGSDYYMTDPDRWYHIAVTYDSTLSEAEGDNLFLYLNGQVAASGRAEGAIVDIRSIWFGRLVKAIGGAIGEIAAYGSALSEDLINESMDCGPVSDDSRVFYWPLNQGSGNAVTDPVSGLILYLGDAGDNTKYEPVWIAADYRVDTDGDNIADSCDNCPGIPNDQADQDGDGTGNLCDKCSNDGPGSSGGECAYASSVAVVGAATGLTPTVLFTWDDPDGTAPSTYMVTQDCDNIVFECWNPDTGEMFKASCKRTPGYMVTVTEDNIPGGDLVLYEDGDSTETTCDLLKRFPLEAFANGACCRAIYIASTEDRDYDWATGDCLNVDGLCIEPIPGDINFQYGQIFTGTVTSNEFCIAPISSVPVNIKHTSFPNSINLSGGGVITVGIYTTDDFDATTVNPSTVRLGDRLSGTFSTCEPKKFEIRDLSDTLCKDTPILGDPNDVGACNPDNRADLLLQFDVLCLPFTHDLEVTVSGQTFDGANIIGTDYLIVR